jgi:phosphoenolpyruvate-protein phosphotransferase/dihydroxyacetone kinase phosphotransfer subunit
LIKKLVWVYPAHPLDEIGGWDAPCLGKKYSMVGIVLVSHSRALAEALRELVHQVASNDVPLAIAAGVGPQREEFGTDAIEITEAIQSVYSDDGVLVLMDLGSAILSAEMALELLPDEMKSKIRFCAAPVVEGAIAAGVQAGLGMDLDTICREARQALGPKAEQLGQSEAVETPSAEPLPAQASEETQEIQLTLRNLHGLHARPAARFVQTAAAYTADVRVRNLRTGKGPVSARSLNALATLGAVNGDVIAVSASGDQAQQALQALSKLVEENFGETAAEAESAALPPGPSEAAQPAEAPPGALPAVAVSEGIALGPLYRYQPAPPPIPQTPASDPDAEWERLLQAINQTEKAIRQRRQQLGRSLGEAQAAIFDAHLLILQDPDLREKVQADIRENHHNAAAAWHTNMQEVAESYRALPDAYLQQRAADVMDVGNQVLFALAGKASAEPVRFSEPVILSAQDLTPTETSQLDMSQVLGIVTAGGGPTSHSAILARALGVPALSGLDLSARDIKPGTLLGLDGFQGRLWVDPPSDIRQKLEERRKTWLEQRQKLLNRSHEPAILRDGTHVEVVANIGKVADAQAAVQNGAEGIGLLRTEFLYLTRQTPPSEEEQLKSLLQIGAVLDQRPIIVRTLDVGGDKALPYIDLAPEENPFLGVRAIRLCLKRPDLFLPQLRAILRAAADYRMRIMFPMVANCGEVIQAKAMLEQAHNELAGENLSHCWPIETGIMVEIPAAALLSDSLAREVDFFSIGTNDLTQYTLAAERGNAALAGLNDALHPAVLRLIQRVAEASHQQGKWTGVCGELAGDPYAVPILVGLGVDELSMNPSGIPRIKDLLRRIDRKMVKPLAEKAIQSTSPSEVRELARNFIEALPEE